MAAAGEDAPFEATSVDLATLAVTHTDFVYRVLRRAGLDDGLAQDGTQNVFLIVARKLSSIGAGRERTFIYATAQYVAAELRRTMSRRGETELTEEDVGFELPSIDDDIDRRRARDFLDQVLAAMPDHLRQVFVLSELEELTGREVAACLDLPLGTVSSRLARARVVFDECLSRALARRASRRPR